MNESKKIYTNPFFVAIAAIFCCALWGSATPFIKLGYQLILPVKDTASTILFAGVRFTFAGILTILIYSVARRKLLLPKKENLGKIATVSCFQTVIQYLFFYIGLANTSGVKGTVLSASNAFFSLLVASLIFRQEKLTLKKIAACCLGFAGIIIINLEGLDLKFNLTGDGFVLLSTIAYGVSSVLMKRYSKYEDPVIISGYQFFAGGIVMILAGLVLGGHIVVNGVQAVLILTYLAFLSAAAYSIWGILLKYNPVSKVTIYSFCIPVFGVLLSRLMLTESAEVSMMNLLITMVLLCSGIIMLNYQKTPKQ